MKTLVVIAVLYAVLFILNVVVFALLAWKVRQLK